MESIKKRCLIEMLRVRYNRSRKKEKGEILEELGEQLGIGRKQAQRLLGAKEVGRPRNPLRRGRPSRYRDVEFIAALKLVWKTTKYMCSRHLRAAIPDWLPAIEAERGPFSESVRERLLAISAPTIDRALRPYKVIKGKTFTRSGGFRDEIPIQENIWDIKVPGYLETDTVAHCGGSMLGEFVNSLTMVDVATMWTEVRAVFGRGSTPIVHAIEDIESALPFAILGYDADNGGEVLNQHVFRYFRDERIARGKPPVQVTRSRAYRKNDNAHVEQRNNSVPRRWLGYERLPFTELVPLINYYYRDIICPMMNHFFPSFKLKDKVRIKSRTRRIYADPITPYARVMASPYVSKEQKKYLKAIHEKLNPVILGRLESTVRKKIDQELKRLRITAPLSYPSRAPSGGDAKRGRMLEA
jgi:hypothetical protein